MDAYSHMHHVFSKSIADFHIYRRPEDFQRMIQTIRYYQYDDLPMPFSNFQRICLVQEHGFDVTITKLAKERHWTKRVEILAYCLMNTHLHLIVRETRPGCLSNYMSDILNSYSRFFNKCYSRKGPLWQSRFGRLSILGEENLLHVASYVHLNPVKAFLTDVPEQWPYSSFCEPTRFTKAADGCFCVLMEHLKMGAKDYSDYVHRQIEKPSRHKRTS